MIELDWPKKMAYKPHPFDDETIHKPRMLLYALETTWLMWSTSRNYIAS